ncbi:MAG: GMC oxidoreductase [Paracoccus sp. (in: a-proteobacteria)]
MTGKLSDRIYDALIVGSGASGMFAASELTAQGLDVLMLEAGPALQARDFDPALKSGAKAGLNVSARAMTMLRGQPIQSRAVFYRRWQAHFFVNDRRNPYTAPRDAPYLWIRGRQRGGRLHSFGRVLMRWSDAEFQSRTLRGFGCDWPIRYADLAPYYDEVETALEVQGNRDRVASMPDGVYARPSGLTPAEALFKARVEAARPGQRVVAWRYVAPDPERLHRPLRNALATGRLTLLNGAAACKVLTDPRNGRATGVAFTEASSGIIRLARARAVVLCASSIESVRLLLNSRGVRHPDGIGNSHDQLGRYFQDQLPLVAQGEFPEASGSFADPLAPRDPFYDTTGGIFIPRSDGHDFAFQGLVGRAEVRADQPARLAFFGFGEMQPDPGNRITLDPRRKDACGIPVPHIRCKMGCRDTRNLHRQCQTLQDIVETAGGRLDFIGSPLGLREWGRGAYCREGRLSRFLFRQMFCRSMIMGAAIHESGGARMGISPADSVLNPWNQCWDAPNLLVTDASAFAGGGVTGTTLTLMALTLRACRHLAAEMAAGRV